MPNYKQLLLITISGLSLMSSGLYAATPSAEVPPPPVIPDEFEEQSNIKADVTIRKGKNKVIEEYRINGALYMVRIIPTIGKPYYLKFPEGENGPAIRSELESIQTPFWKLFEW
ncbi:MAG: DUF2782 domain-containing protein [Gammaproteobacteria bacterium]|nr:DUF2782 domain-containing protein [Gammaproteobacteria bacterium]